MGIKKTVIIALGGNALSPKNEAGTIQQQFKHTRNSLKSVLHFVKSDYNICITHGNGPQVGAEMSRNEISMDKIPPLPLNVLVANTQGAMGYMIQQSLQNALYAINSKREVVSIISQMKVDSNDPAINKPSKFIGKTFTKEKAIVLASKYKWNIAEQDKGEWRRVVPSPNPLYIFNGKSIKYLVDFGTIVLAGGGGGFYWGASCCRNPEAYIDLMPLFTTSLFSLVGAVIVPLSYLQLSSILSNSLELKDCS